MAPYEALYGHKCMTPMCWTELGEKKVLRSNLVQEMENTVKIIRDHLRRKDIELSVGNRVFLKVSPCKNVLGFGHKGKYSLRFIGPYRIIKRVGPVAYQTDRIHDIEVCPDFLFDEKPVEILDREVKVL
ncbi:DNA/RNA polymerases superfamily protein [Gossypium australe]|uniref:DNA/RNA polymerases superfamily protein n=1 Tax=Gossypium australe TaxID=47621 RepID=A0A5B6V9F9_9ROSI|nr:DNA/RNA polymerases superfamily protein [Gossypium australe]